MAARSRAFAPADGASRYTFYPRALAIFYTVHPQASRGIGARRMTYTQSKASTELDDALAGEQIQAVCISQVMAVPMNVALAISVVVICRNEVGLSSLLPWLAGIVLINAMRFALALAHKRAARMPRTRRMLHLNGALMLATGALWAFVPATRLDLASPSAPYILFVLAGLSAGATVQAGTYWHGAVAFVLPIFATLIAKLAAAGDAGGYLLSIDALLYLLLLCVSARRSEQAFTKTVLLRIQAMSLADSLDREHTASKAAAAQYYQLANHDALTGLANRAAFAALLGTWLDRAAAERGRFHLLLLDLDHFKSINDTLGHSAGDEILKEAAQRLDSAVDGDHVVARLGGDEFAILLPLASDPAGSDEAALGGVIGALLARISEPFRLGAQTVTTGVSIGVAQYPDDASTAEDLLAHADLALYAAKDGGRHAWRRFDASLRADATLARDIEHDLPAALAAGRLRVFFQPQVSLGDHRLVGLEALLRWYHPTHGWVAPPIVVAAARRIRKSDLLTEFVLGEACAWIRRLADAGRPEVRVAVNVSPSEFGHYDLPDMLARAVDAHGIDCRQLEVEITEETFAASKDSLATLSALSALGVRLAIDDFGTGCSSLAYLRSMRVDRIKIDRSFVTGFAAREDDRILVQAILGIGRSFGIEVVAEGVESADEALLLGALGCSVVQGYYFGRPMDGDALATLLAAEGPRTATPGADWPAPAAEAA